MTLGEGWTPLVCGKIDGIAVTMKLEFMAPTGSFKDRGMTTLISYLQSRGISSVLEDSSGNAGASLAAYSAAAGMQAAFSCRKPLRIRKSRKWRRPAPTSYPQRLASGRRGRRAALPTQIFYASHNWQPFFLEGTKTLAYELWEQLGFRLPITSCFRSAMAAICAAASADSGIETAG